MSVNPPANQLGHMNAILRGRSSRYHVSDFRGPLSLKSVSRGSADWTAGGRRFRVTPSELLILNDGQDYSITVDSKNTVETFCIFFASGYVEEAHRAAAAPPEQLLDDPDARSAIRFVERRYGTRPEIARVFESMRNAPDEEALEEYFRALAGLVLGLRHETTREIAAVPAVRAATRDELYKRLLRGKEFLDDCHDRRVRLEDAAREACLSRFHFHRLFLAAFGRTPHEYVQSRRLERAARLLKTSDAPVELICAQCGFASVSSFTTLFRRERGLPPAAWRRAR